MRSVTGSRVVLLALMICFGVACSKKDNNPESERKNVHRKNVLLINVDDLNHSIGSFHNQALRTPNIDKLARRGVRFSHAYCQWPQCVQSRFSFLSGWYPTKTRAFRVQTGPRDGPLKKAIYLPEHFKSNGFFSVRLDKIFHIGKDDRESWDISEEPVKDWLGRNKTIETMEEIHTLDLHSHILQTGKKRIGNQEKTAYAIVDLPDEKLLDGITAQRAIEILNRLAESGDSFFLGVGFRRPHVPWIAPRKYFELYPPEKIELPPKQPGIREGDGSEEEQRRFISAYYACVTFIDAQIGKVLNALERTGLAKNTIVVLFGDQGFNLGERDGYFGKANLFERSLRVPLIIAAPQAAGNGRECNRIIELLDIYPTLLNLCGISPPSSGIQGRNLAPLLQDPDKVWEDRALSFYSNDGDPRLQRTIRTPQFRYVEGHDGTPLALYKYDIDPFEWNNLVDNPEYSVVVASLQSQLRGLLKKIS